MGKIPYLPILYVVVTSVKCIALLFNSYNEYNVELKKIEEIVAKRAANLEEAIAINPYNG